jgi:starch synthase
LKMPAKQPVQDFTGPTPTSPLFGGSSSSSAAPAAAAASPAAPSKAPAAPSSSSSKPAGPSSSSTAIVDVGPPAPPPKPKVEEILDIPDPVEKAVASVKKLTPEEQARRDEAKRVLRANAQKEVDTHDPVKLAALRHSWLIFTVPEKPVAGAGSCCVQDFAFLLSTLNPSVPMIRR